MSAAVLLALAAIAAAQTPIIPPTGSGPFQLQTVSSDTNFDGLTLAAYHASAGADVIFTTKDTPTPTSFSYNTTTGTIFSQVAGSYIYTLSLQNQSFTNLWTLPPSFAYVNFGSVTEQGQTFAFAGNNVDPASYAGNVLAICKLQDASPQEPVSQPLALLFHAANEQPMAGCGDVTLKAVFGASNATTSASSTSTSTSTATITSLTTASVTSISTPVGTVTNPGVGPISATPSSVASTSTTVTATPSSTTSSVAIVSTISDGQAQAPTTTTVGAVGASQSATPSVAPYVPGASGAASGKSMTAWVAGVMFAVMGGACALL